MKSMVEYVEIANLSPRQQTLMQNLQSCFESKNLFWLLVFNVILITFSRLANQFNALNVSLNIIELVLIYFVCKGLVYLMLMNRCKFKIYRQNENSEELFVKKLRGVYL